MHRGPPENVAFGPDGELSQAGAGFARRHNRAAHELVRRDGFVFVEADAVAHPAAEVLPEVVRGLVEGLAFPKNMRWGGSPCGSPARSAGSSACTATTVVDVELAGVRSGRVSQGHRFLGGPVELQEAGGLRGGAPRPARHGERRCAARGHRARARRAPRLGRSRRRPRRGRPPDGVAERAARLLPRALPRAAGPRDHHRHAEPPALPAAARRATARRRRTSASSRTPAPRRRTSVVTGNERVVRGRLDDAAFSLAKDLEVGLAGLADGLARISYHARAGSLADRTARLEVLAGALADALAVERGRAHERA